MADIDLMPARGVPFRAQVEPTGIALGGTATIEQLAQRGMRPVCIVDNVGLNAGVTVEQLAQRGIRAACLVDENGLASGVSADELRRRGIRPLVQLTALGLSGSTTMLQLAQRGLDYACLVDQTGAATGGGGSTFVTWEAATATAVTLSGGDLIVTNTGTTSADQGARVATASGKTSGKFYFEITCNTKLTGTASGLGIGLGTPPTTTYTNINDPGGLGAWLDMTDPGNQRVNGVTGGTSMGGAVNGTVYGIAVDLDNDKCWFRINSIGLWNGQVIGSQNPVGNVGGHALNAAANVPFITFGGSGNVAGNVFTANFGASAFGGAVPSGFTAGWVA